MALVEVASVVEPGCKASVPVVVLVLVEQAEQVETAEVEVVAQRRVVVWEKELQSSGQETVQRVWALWMLVRLCLPSLPLLSASPGRLSAH